MKYAKFLHAQHDCARPILQWASKCSGIFMLHEVANATAYHFSISDEIRDKLVAGGLNIFDNRAICFIIYLKCIRLLRQTCERCCEITRADRHKAFTSDECMTNAYLTSNFRDYIHE